MTEPHPDHMYCTQGSDPKARHAWLRIREDPVGRATFVCVRCCQLVHHLPGGRRVGGERAAPVELTTQPAA